MSEVPPGRAPVVCIGKFDALHRGHRALVEAARPWGRPTLLRFSGMAEALGWPPRPALVAEAERTRLLAAWAADEAVLPFAEVRSCDPAAFLALLADRLAPIGLVVGEDFRGGPRRTAGAEDFRRAAADRGWSAVVVPLVAAGAAPVSSSRIRNLLEVGAVAEAADLLGRPHRLTGIVVRGDGRGRRIGIPTANLRVTEVLLPARGVYAAWAELDGRRVPAAVNIGTVPTAGDGRAATCEAHLIGWSGDAYDRPMSLDLVGRLREERRFASFDELVVQIRADIAAVPAYLGR